MMSYRSINNNIGSMGRVDKKPKTTLTLARPIHIKNSIGSEHKPLTSLQDNQPLGALPQERRNRNLHHFFEGLCYRKQLRTNAGPVSTYPENHTVWLPRLKLKKNGQTDILLLCIIDEKLKKIQTELLNLEVCFRVSKPTGEM